MMALLLTLTLNLLHNAAADADPWSSLRQLNVPFLHTSNFTSHLQKTPSVVVVFVAPWCSISKTFVEDLSEAPTLDPAETGSNLLPSDPSFPIAIVDAAKHQQLYDEHHISTFPTAKLFRWGVVSDEYQAISGKDWKPAALASFYNASMMRGMMSDGFTPVGTVSVIADLDGMLDLIAGAGMWDSVAMDDEEEEVVEVVVEVEEKAAHPIPKFVVSPILLAWFPTTSSRGGNHHVLHHKHWHASSPFLASAHALSLRHVTFVRTGNERLMEQMLRLTEKSGTIEDLRESARESFGGASASDGSMFGGGGGKSGGDHAEMKDLHAAPIYLLITPKTWRGANSVEFPDNDDILAVEFSTPEEMEAMYEGQ